jgi:DNA polymerase
MKDIFYKQAMETTVYQQFCNAFKFGCSRCTLSDHGCPPILCRGNPDSDILLVGEAPGLVEQQQMKPFVGPAGELLDKIMAAIGLSTEDDMLITNCVFCRPVARQYSGRQNYTPKKDQIVRCWPFVERIIELTKPQVIIACGRTALSQLTGDTNIRIGPWEGRWLKYKDEIPMFVMTHTAAILHKAPWPDEQRQMKIKVWKYMQYFGETWKEKAA